MATPTASKLASAQAVATPPVSTPFSASNHPPAFSPHGPRSVVPSPQQFKKSPANSNTLYGYPSGSGGGHPTNSSFGAGYDSPSAALALSAVPGLSDLGLEGMGTPVPVPLVGGVRADEDERKRRLQQVVDILKTNKGRLSEPGIERLARRVGLDCVWDDHMGSAGNTRTLIIAGSVMALDIDFSNDVVKKVSLSFPESPEIVTRHTQQAGDILLRDLQFAPKESPLTKMLNRFAANLERLATLDKLSVVPSLNCHEAIAGIYESLERLHKWEASRLKEQDDMAGKDDEYIGRCAMCTKSGKPVMHTRDRLGLSIDYWQEKRRLTSTSSKRAKSKTWSLLVECSALPDYGYSPLRVSERWISSEILKADPDAEELMLATVGGPVLDWLEPENVILSSAEAPNPDAMDGIDRPPDGKFPEVMFVAKFDPPIIVPYGVAVQVHTSTNAHMDIYQMNTFDGLLLPQDSDNKAEAGEARVIKQQKAVPIYTKEGDKSTRTHNNTLFIDKVDYGQTLSELPFSHPRQLVEMLPQLRQYAFLATVLKNSFRAENAVSDGEKSSPRATRKEKFADFMAKIPVADPSALTVDVSLVTLPPSLKLVFPFKDRTANIKFDIKPNGIVEVKEQNVIDEDAMDEGKALTVADLGRILEVTGDLGIWAEYVTELTS